MAGMYLSIKEAIELAGVHRSTVLYWIRQGLVKAVKANGVWQIPQQDVMILKAAREGRAKARALGLRAINKF